MKVDEIAMASADERRILFSDGGHFGRRSKRFTMSIIVLRRKRHRVASRATTTIYIVCIIRRSMLRLKPI